MEQIKVNMTPCGFTPTIHASQDDNSTRKWGFELYDEDGKIDSSGIKEQMIFDSRVGGTEQILPENTSNPTTSPIIADIQYPDSLRSEQTFLYRESPTQEDGQAKITHIKGNTVVFNQLIQNGNFVDTSNWTFNTLTPTIANNKATYSGFGSEVSCQARYSSNIIFSNNHDYLICFDLETSADISSRLMVVTSDWNISYQTPQLRYSSKTRVSYVLSKNNLTSDFIRLWFVFDKPSNSNPSWSITNFIMVDLTQLNNSAITDATSFRRYYNLPYYDYTQGKLLPFKGESLKVTGKNIFDLSYSDTSPHDGGAGVTFTKLADGGIKLEGTATGTNYYNLSFLASASSSLFGYSGVLIGKELTFTCENIPANVGMFVDIFTTSGNTSLGLVRDTTPSLTVTIPSDFTGLRIYLRASSGYSGTTTIYPMIRFADVQDATFEPYTSSTINLPTLDYFPSGMKSAGTVYDELTESKAITRVGSVDLGSLTWGASVSGYGTHYVMYSDDLKNVAKVPSGNDRKANIVCGRYETKIANDPYLEVVGVGLLTSGRLFIYDTNYNTSSSASAFKTAMSGVYLYYELTTPTEESITTASLVTEKGETPLYYDDELIADCNETISSESGIFDAKIKLMADETIYSQKIQLHVERKPQ